MKTATDIIKEFNENHSIESVLKDLGIERKGNNYKCPFHDDVHPSASTKNNMFKCFVCNDKAVKPWDFIAKYYNLNGFVSIARKANQLYNTNIMIWENSPAPVKKRTVTTIMDDRDKSNKIDSIPYTVNKYLSDTAPAIRNDLESYRHILLGANTGLGKTYGMSEVATTLPVDYVIFFVPNRSIAEQVAEEGQFSLFYDNMEELPKNKYIVATYHKVGAIERAFNSINRYRLMEYQDGAYNFDDVIKYAVILDEVHCIMDSRNMYLKFIRELENFITFSDYSVMMSANIKDIHRAYKDSGLFRKVIEVGPATKHYNADNLYIYRLDNFTKRRIKTTVDIIVDKLKTHNNILFYKDNINYMNQLQEQLKDKGINVVFINSKNKKDDEEAEEEYRNIISNSSLKKTVVLVTSVINAGVNIKTNNVCAICDMPRSTMNSNKMIQFFGRLRGDSKNSLIWLLGITEAPAKDFFRDRDFYKEQITTRVKRQTNSLNMDIFDIYGLDTNDNEIVADWNIYKTGKAYEYTRNCIYYNNGLFKIDYIGIEEQARLKEERENYYSDEFIIYLTNTLKVRKVHNIKIIEATGAIEEIEVAEKVLDITFEKQLEIISNDQIANRELMDYLTGKINNKKLTGEVKKLYDEFKEDRKFKDYKKVGKEFIIQSLEGSSKSKKSAVEVFKDINKLFIEDVKPKVLELNILNYRRVNFLNKMLPIGTVRDISNTGDSEYYIVRKYCDCFVKNNNKINKIAWGQIEEDYLEDVGAKYNSDKGQWEDFKNKKISLKKLKTKFESCIRQIYNCSEDFRLISLK